MFTPKSLNIGPLCVCVWGGPTEFYQCCHHLVLNIECGE